MKAENSSNDIDKIDDFLDIYEKLVNTLEYDEGYAETAEIEDELDELSAYQIEQRNIERTKNHPKGDSKIFAMRLSYELTNLGIENRLMVAQRPNGLHWVNLYKDNEQWNVANITDHIIYKNGKVNVRSNNSEDYVRLPTEAFLLYNPNSLILEEIQDDGRKLEDLTMKPFYSMDQAEQENNGELIVKETNIFKRIKNWFKQIVRDLGWEDLFEPYVPPKHIEDTDALNEELLKENDKNNFVPKAKVDETVAVKRAEEKAKQSSKVDEKSK